MGTPRYDPSRETEKFWSRVEFSSSPEACWRWTAGAHSDGRGLMNWRGRKTLVYRISWELEHGAPPPNDMHVCHHCDNPACVRPGHLFLGRDLENVRDMWTKGRASAPPHSFGEAHHNANVSDEQVRWAREQYASGELNVTQIANALGVATSTLGAWLDGRTRIKAGGPMRLITTT